MVFIQKIVSWFKRPNKSWIAENVESLIFVGIIAFLIRTFIFGLYIVPTCSMEPKILVGERFFADKFSVWFSSPKRGDIITFNEPTYQYSDNTFIRFLQRYVWYPGGPSNWTKRVIGIPGDEVVGVVEDGKPEIYLNGKKLDEPYINPYPLVAEAKNDGTISYKTYNTDFSFEDQPFYKFDPSMVERAGKFLFGVDKMSILYPNTPLPWYSGGSDTFKYQLKDGQYFCLGDNRLGSYDGRGWGVLDSNKVDIHGKILFRTWSQDTDESNWLFDLIKHPIDFWKKIRWSRCLNVVK